MQISPLKKIIKKSLKLKNQIPQDILLDPDILKAISKLPKNYNFELLKSIHQIRSAKSTRVALQFPEGLLLYSLVIADILEEFCACEVVVMGDVTYGACCIDDYSARAINCDFMIHYGHSCLVPIDVTLIKCLYVFVDIKFNTQKFIASVKLNFERGTRIALVATIQFVGSLQSIKEVLSLDYILTIPQSRPLSSGEVLGCTAPKFINNDIFIYLGDGRFHLEACMIANPALKSFRYDPYSNKLTSESYDHAEMRRQRSDAISLSSSARVFGLIQGTLGRQGAPHVIKYLIDLLTSKQKDFIVVLLSEISPQKLEAFCGVDCWIQVACPRLSIDWGYAYSKPLLTPYEAAVLLKEIDCDWLVESPSLDPSNDASNNDVPNLTGSAPNHSKTINSLGTYPMDFYAKDSLGPWTPNHKPRLISTNPMKGDTNGPESTNTTIIQDGASKLQNGSCGCLNGLEQKDGICDIGKQGVEIGCCNSQS